MSYPSIPSPVTTARESHGFRGQGDSEHAADPATRHTPHAALLQRCGRMAVGALLVAQSAFVAYLLGSYGRATLACDVTAWSRFSARGWVPGDAPGNAAMALHLIFAVLVLCAGAVQLSSGIRRRVPRVHRWSGRLYLTGSLVGAISGLWLVWVRDTVGDLPQHVAISLNALLLVGCAGMTWRAIRRRDVAAHRAWAIRTIVVANGVLFFRLLLALWLVVWRAPVGFDAERFSGPFLTALAFTVYVFGPLCVFEAYRWGERSRSRTVHVGVSVGLIGVALLCLMGAASAMLVLWLPRLS